MKYKREVLSILVLTSLNLLLRIPRFLSTAQGLDGFYVVWEAELIFKGIYFSKGLNLGYLLGLYPFSGYPIGTLYVMSFFLLITNHNIMASILLYDYFFTIIFVIGLYYLSKKLNLKFYSRILFVLFASTQPVVMQYSYFNSSARLPFFAIAPFVFGLLIDWLKTKKHHKLAISILIIAFLGLFHRISLLFVVVLFIGLIILLYDSYKSKRNGKITNSNFIKKLSESRITKYIQNRKFILLILLSYMISPFIFMDIFRPAFNLKELVTVEYGFVNFIFRYLQMMTDQWFRIGLPLLLSIFCLIVLSLPKYNNLLEKFNQNSEVKKMLLFTFPFLLMANNIYSYYFFFLAYSLIPAVLFEIVREDNNHFKLKYTFLIISSFLVFLYIIIYHFLIRAVGPYPIISGCIFGVISIFSILTLFKEKIQFKTPKNILTKRKIEIILTLLVILLFANSLFQMDRHTIFWNRDGYLFSYISDEEIALADFLETEGFGVFDSFDHVLSTHVAVLSGWLFIQDMHGISVNIQNENISTIDDYNCFLKPFWQWYERELFSCDFRSGGLNYKDIITNNYNDTLVVNLLSTYEVKYFITAKNSSLVEFWDSIVDSLFISSLMNSSTPVVFTTDHFLVWNVSTIY